MDSGTERARFFALARIVLYVSLFGCLCTPAPTAISTDTCTNPTTGTVDSVEIAATRLSGEGQGFGMADDAADPRALADHDRVWTLRGGQGATMLGVRLVLRGPDVPNCIDEDTQVTVDGVLVAHSKDKVTTFPLADGARATHTLWLPGAYRTEARLETTAAGKRGAVTVDTAGTDTCTAARVCPCAFALGCACTEGLSDAGRALWDSLKRCEQAACDAGEGSDGGTCGASSRADGGACSEAALACRADGF